MEQEFRTTFIPKKPIVPQSSQSSAPVSKPVGILFVISVIIFVVSLAIAGSVYGYKAYLQNQVSELAISLDKVQKTLDPNTIKEFTVMDKRLRNSETLLNQHVVISPLFKVLGTTTLPTIRYTKMDMSFGDTGNLLVSMSGESDGYRSIALQSQALAQNADLGDTIFSNFTVTPKGRVSFDVAFTIPKNDLVFSKNLPDAQSQNGLGQSVDALSGNTTTDMMAETQETAVEVTPIETAPAQPVTNGSSSKR